MANVSSQGVEDVKADHRQRKMMTPTTEKASSSSVHLSVTNTHTELLNLFGYIFEPNQPRKFLRPIGEAMMQTPEAREFVRLKWMKFE